MSKLGDALIANAALRAEVARLQADLGQKDAVIDVCREIASMHLNTVTVEQIRLALAILDADEVLSHPLPVSPSITQTGGEG